MPDTASSWTLDPAIAFLNHGSFGAAPLPVLQYQTSLRERMERQPVQFFMRDLPGMLDEARGELASFVGSDPDDIAFVVNATSGVNAVLRSLPFGPGDELLTTNHAYGACRAAMEFVAARNGARLVIADIELPIRSAGDVVDEVAARVTPRTRLAVIDHVTSPTALVLPIKEIVARLSGLGVDTLVDGAHAPGMVPLGVDALGAAYYTGNCHKWLCAPKGAGFLHVRPDRQAGIAPTAISHGYLSARRNRSQFRELFDWTGTRDPTAYLSVPAALHFIGEHLPGGWDEVMERNRMLARSAQDLIEHRLGIEPAAPSAMVGSMAAVHLPGAFRPATPGANWDQLQDRLLEEHHIEVPIFAWPAAPRRVLRLSAHLYNRPEQYRRLADALAALLEAGGVV